MSNKQNDIYEEHKFENKQTSDNFPMKELNDITNESLTNAEKNLSSASATLKDIIYSDERECNFCDSTDTIEYSAEGNGSVWLCEDCRSIGAGESADL